MHTHANHTNNEHGIDKLTEDASTLTGLDKHQCIMKHMRSMFDMDVSELDAYVTYDVALALNLKGNDVKRIVSAVKAEYKTHKSMTKAEQIRDADNAIMQSIDDLQDNAPIYFDENRMIWKWNHYKLVYEMVDDTDVLNTIEKTLGYMVYKTKDKSEMMELVRQSGRKRGISPPDKNVIVFKGTAVNVMTGNGTTPTPDKLYTSYIPHSIGASEDTPTFDKLFKDWAGEEYMTLYEIFAYCMLDDYPIHRAFPFTGTGRNGKSEFIRLLTKFIGKDNCVSTSLDKLANSRFETAKLYKRKVAIIAETDAGVQMKTSVMKGLTGGDTIGAEFKGLNGFDFLNTAKIIIATNSMPPTKDKTDGFYRRFLITPFDNEFEETGSVISTITDTEFSNMVRKCIGILRNVLDDGFTHDGDVDHRRAMYEIKSNPIGTFLKDCCDIDDDHNTPLWYLFKKFQTFSKRGGYPEMNKNDFKMVLNDDYGFTIANEYFSADLKKIYKPIINNEGSRWEEIKGIRFKTPINDEWSKTKSSKTVV